MCDIAQYHKGNNNYLICKTTGKPITETNEYGMYCEDLCDMDKDKDFEMSYVINKMSEMFNKFN